MSILNTSVSGMLANASWLTTIAQNVANANTPGYKSVETSFSALVDSAQGSTSQFAGVVAGTVAMNSLQGQVQQTTTKTDLAVQGAGFLIAQDTSGNIYLTRDGSFTPDASGNLVNADGYFLLGSPVGATGVALNSLSGLTKVNVTNAADNSIPSTTATLIANLPSQAPAVAAPTPSANVAGSQFTAETSAVTYDDLGAAHTINLYFTKTGTGTWEVDAYEAAGAGAGGGFPYSSGPLSTQTLNFSSTTGALTSGSPFKFTVPGGLQVSIDMSSSTQLASGFTVSSINVNGNAPGTIIGVSISNAGTLSFNYGNGSITPAYTIPLAKVASPNNLNSILGNAFQANPQSGAPEVGIAGTAGLGNIVSSALESSTVDLASELTNMVEAQSTYQANSKVFQTGAKLLDILNSIQS
jgi:flagellar hook protein FlgE